MTGQRQWIGDQWNSALIFHRYDNATSNLEFPHIRPEIFGKYDPMFGYLNIAIGELEILA